MRTYRLGVGELVSFLFSSGDLTSDTFQNVSMLEGTKAHQYVQSTYKDMDQAEVSISLTLPYADDLNLVISGRIDGLLSLDEGLMIEEIKSTRKRIFDDQFAPNSEHVAQLKMYAYMYMKNNHITDVRGRVTYIQLSDYRTRSFEDVYDIDLLEDFFHQAIADYLVWLNKLYTHQEKKRQSLSSIVFPFDTYRRGQREMMSAVYQTMMEDDILYAIAPTGIGKTMASVFATLKALKDERQKIFYLTAKTQGKRIAIDTLDMLHEAGLETKTLEITSKDAICFLDKRDCDPEKCPFAKGFFDRLTEAMVDIFDHERLMTRSVVERYAKNHQVCPFEFSLFVSYFVDVIICDYNYVFDPRAHLIRYFDDTSYQPLLLIDEAHNMISRSRDMYSASLLASDLIRLRRSASQIKPSIRHAIKKMLDLFDVMAKDLEHSDFVSFTEPSIELIDTIKYVMKKIENTLKENPKYPRKSDVMDGYLILLGFIRIYDYYGDQYLTTLEKTSDGDVKVTLQCLDASPFIHETVKDKAFGTVFFSATLYPIEYYKTLLTEGKGETLKIRSPFDSDRLKLILMNQISTRYQDRTSSISDVVKIIETTVKSKKGNYIAFFPSYQYLNQILENLPSDLDADILTQEKDMSLMARDDTLNRFKDGLIRTRLGMFVMGGMFSEGIDYVGDMLHGVIIVGVGLPMVSESNNLLRAYYQKQFAKGFDYAYTYPGMNKVIQAVGRVIRSVDDYGVAILIDDRFTTQTYKRLFPLEWKKPVVVQKVQQLHVILNDFWSIYE